MVQGMIGKKLGMFQMFDDSGRALGCLRGSSRTLDGHSKNARWNGSNSALTSEKKAAVQAEPGVLKKAGIDPLSGPS